MSSLVESAVAAVIILGAIAYLAARVRHGIVTARAKKPGAGCSGCEPG